MERLENNSWVTIDESDLNDGDFYRVLINGGYEAKHYKTPVFESIRIISTGSMQRRFTIPEEVFISNDAAATVIKSRLLNASFCDLDFPDTVDGVDYICQVLLDGGIIADKDARKAQLLQDGIERERA